MGPSVIFLSIGTTAALLSAVGTLIVLAVVVFIFLNSSQKEEDKDTAKQKVYTIRLRYFFGLVLLVILGLFITLRLLPYPDFQDNPDVFVTVQAKQWFWEMKPGVPDSNADESPSINSIKVPVNEQVEFAVTATDVTHSFGVYTNSGTLLTQVQAMPGYYHKLRYKFTEKGEYPILCLEYCGIPHGIMMGKIIVE